MVSDQVIFFGQVFVCCLFPSMLYVYETLSLLTCFSNHLLAGVGLKQVEEKRFLIRGVTSVDISVTLYRSLEEYMCC